MTPASMAIVAARRQLHFVAESFIAGPQYRAAGSIRLTARSDGFAGVALPVAVRGTILVCPQGQVPLAGSVAAVIQASGLDVGPPPVAVYEAVAPLASDTILDIDPACAELIYRAMFAGHQAVKSIALQHDPVLWPEHFDVGATVDEVNYGVSAGDDHHELPYAYVGPWTPRTGTFWNAPFGALQPLDLEDDLAALVAGISGFFRRAQDHL